ncbi:sodium:proton exchanger [Candidatus Micrarchaeota archaeon CG10_big_fil_rev_8_21_14_0_10_45_29]|nr:MAG: sodium:proton exchanger [Candidatus Micrarchaeota archaeon CG10_big_fil_rev_8_21_14_0_10_45_29]
MLVLFALGFVCLVKGADFLVEGAVSIARKFDVSDLVVGLTIVSFGTSLPEFVVNVIASFGGNSELLIGNILGSNISNILLIVGITALIYKITLKRGTVYKEIPISLFAALVLILLANDALLDSSASSQIDRGDGFVLLAFFLLFLYYVYGITRNREEKEIHHTSAKYPPHISVFYILAGILGLYLGGVWVVDGAVEMATFFGISQSVIGLTIVAIGTSLPELVTSAVAAMKKNSDLAIGNIVGSNIFNIFFVLGASAIITPVPFLFERNLDLGVVIFASLLLFMFAAIFKPPHVISKKEGALLFICYVIYIAFLVISA